MHQIPFFKKNSQKQRQCFSIFVLDNTIMNWENLNSDRISKWMQRKDAFSRWFHIKRRNGLGEWNKITDEVHHCLNCGEEFKGNYCPRCGQSVKEKKLSFHSVIDNVMAGLTNVGYGFWRTSLEMFFRPGYMVRDFIKGKRVNYFKPFQMLFVMAAVFSVEVALLHPQISQTDSQPQPTLPDTVQTRITDASKNYQENILKEINKRETINDSIQNAAQLAVVSTQIDSVEKNMALQSLSYTNKSGDSTKKNISDSILSAEAELLANLNKEKSRLMATSISKGKAQGDSIGKKKNFMEQFGDDAVKFYNAGNDKVNHPYMAAFFSMIKSSITGNRAIAVVLALPLFVLALLRVYRRRGKSYYNAMELSFAYAFIASQQLLILSFLYLFTVVSAGNEGLIFFLLAGWYFSEMFEERFLRALYHTFLVFCRVIFYFMVLSFIAAVFSIIAVEFASLIHFV